MWKVKTIVVAVIIGAMGLIFHTTSEVVEDITRNHKLKKDMFFSTAHIVRLGVFRKVLRITTSNRIKICGNK